MSAVTRSQPDADAVLAKALLNTREHLGLTQQELADIVGVHRSAVSRWSEQGGLRRQSAGSFSGPPVLMLRMAKLERISVTPGMVSSVSVSSRS